MIATPDSIKRYRSAQERFLRPAVVNFFAREFPKLFGPIMREKLADELIDLFQTLSPEIQRLQPGQLLWNALDHRTRGDSPNRRYVPVVLSLITRDDVEQLSQGVAMTTIARRAVGRLFREAYDQGGILSSRDLGLVTLRDPSTVSAIRKAYETEHGCTLPHTGALHDMGSCVSHKRAVIQKVIVEKKDPMDVARECCHTQKAVDRYLKDFHRVQTVYECHKDLDYIHLVTGIAKHVVKEYVDIINTINREQN